MKRRPRGDNTNLSSRDHGRRSRRHLQTEIESNFPDDNSAYQSGHRGRGHHGRRHYGGLHGRAKRGEARYVLLDALLDGPKHGYEIIKTLEERSAGRYVSSPGTVYPTMQYLEELGQVRSEQQAERRVYSLTEQGRTDLDAHAEDVDAFWARFASRSTVHTSRHEVGFLQDQLDDLARTAWGGLREAIERGDQQVIRRVRQAVERCQNEIREIITQPSASKTTQLRGEKK
jgi:DNA-binding PadR family transcriptional regulator